MPRERPPRPPKLFVVTFLDGTVEKYEATGFEIQVGGVVMLWTSARDPTLIAEWKTISIFRD